jgi:Arc/MetJ-type ribon-helix-helix transcriptional regulator
MAVTETRVLPPEFIEAAGKVYLGDLATATGGYKTADLSKAFGQQFVAGQDPLQAQAQQLATQGIGAYKPFLQSASALASPTSYQQFMSPYQQDVINETLKEFDVQAQKGLPTLAAQAVNAGAFGGGREGVQRAEYQSASDRNRAALQAQLLQQGFGQAQTLNQQALANQLNLAGQSQAFLGQDIGALSTFGAQNQALEQAQLGAQQQLAQQQLQQPLTAAQQYGQGVTSLIAGYPGQTTQVNQPSPNPLATAIGAGGTLAGIYRAFNQPGVLNR